MTMMKKTEDNDDNMEMDDDMLMSEQFIQNQERLDKEKQKLAMLKSTESNTNKYLFDIINGRMIEISRKFYQNIDDNTWNQLENDVFANIKNENQYHRQITTSVQSIFEIKQLLL